MFEKKNKNNFVFLEKQQKIPKTMINTVLKSQHECTKIQ